MFFDSQGGKTTEAGSPSGCAAGKKINGRKRHALVDTGGRRPLLRADLASVQGRLGPPTLLKASRALYLFVKHAFADAVNVANRVATGARIVVEMVRTPSGQVGFAVHPRRWVVERFFAWAGRNRRPAQDFRVTVASAQAFLYAASVMLLARRIARST